MRWALVVGAAFLAVGCGSRESTADEKVRAGMAKAQTTCVEGVNCGIGHFRPFRKCTHVSRGFRACTTFARQKRTGIYRRTGERWRNVVGPLPHRLGWWRRVLVSPNRRSLLAQWSGECEVQSTYILPSTGGAPRAIFPVAGAASFALGWSDDGRARVALPSAIVDERRRLLRAGIYRVDPATLTVTLERTIPTGNGC